MPSRGDCRGVATRRIYSIGDHKHTLQKLMSFMGCFATLEMIESRKF